MLENRQKGKPYLLRRSYRREVKKLLRAIRFNRNKNAKLRNSAMRRLRTIANALLGDIARKLAPETRASLNRDLEIYSRAVNQKRNDKNKIYSLHEPEVFCIAKGKEHKNMNLATRLRSHRLSLPGLLWERKMPSMNTTATVWLLCLSRWKQ